MKLVVLTLLAISIASCTSRPVSGKSCSDAMPPGYSLEFIAGEYAAKIDQASYVAWNDRRGWYMDDIYDYLSFTDSCDAKEAAWGHYLTNGTYSKKNHQ